MASNRAVPGKRAVSALAMLAVLSSCTVAPTMREAGKMQDDASKYLSQGPAEKSQNKYDPLEVSDEPWFGDSAMPMKHGRPLPVWAESAASIGVNTGGPMTMEEIVSIIQGEARVPIRLMDMDLPNQANRQNQKSGSGSGSQQASAGSAAPNANTSSHQATVDPRYCLITMDYEGPLSGALDIIDGQCGVSYKYDGASVSIYRYETRRWVLESLPGDLTLADGMTSGSFSTAAANSSSSSASSGSASTSGNSGTSSGSTTQQMTFSSKIDVWADVQNMLSTLVAGDGVFEVSPSTGDIMVRTTPDRMPQIEEFITEENRKLTKQIYLTVEIWDVEFNDGDQYGVDINALLTKASGLQVGYSSAPSLNSSNGSLSVSVVNPPAGSALSKWSGSSVAFQALSTVGRVGVLRRLPLTTLNNKTTRRKITYDQGYLAEVTGNALGGNGVSIGGGLVPSTASNGIEVQFTPRVLDDGRILLQYSLQLLGTPTFTTQSSSNESIQVVGQGTNIFAGQSQLFSGSTMVLGGAEVSNNVVNSQGMGVAYNPLGGSLNSSQQRQQILMVITPVEIKPEAVFEER